MSVMTWSDEYDGMVGIEKHDEIFNFEIRQKFHELFLEISKPFLKFLVKLTTYFISYA